MRKTWAPRWPASRRGAGRRGKACLGLGCPWLTSLWEWSLQQGLPRPQLWSVQEKQPSQAGSACTRPGELGVWCPPGQHWPSRPLPRMPSEQPAGDLVSVNPRAQQHSGGAQAAGRGERPCPLRLLTYRPLSPGPLCLSESEGSGRSPGPAQHFLTGLPGPLMGVEGRLRTHPAGEAPGTYPCPAPA